MVSSSAPGCAASSASTAISRPGAQKPHCSAPSSARHWARSSQRPSRMPSSVVTSRPSTRAMSTEHESTGSPSSSTVQRPQLEVSQAHLTDL